VLLAAICLNIASPATADSSAGADRTGREPITPVPGAPASDPRRLLLGEQLFNDRRLSRTDTHSCAACHDLNTNGASAKMRDVAPSGELLAFNTPTIFNASLSFRLNWEGNFRSLQEHDRHTIHNPAIMASSTDEVVAKLRADPEMVRQFRDAYGKTPAEDILLDALAVYERSLVTPASRFDSWLAGDGAAITAEELSGYRSFKSLGCISCHQGVNVGGNLYQRGGIFHPLGTTESALVRVPSLRNVAATAPYFHDGSAATLPEAVKLMGIAQLGRTLTDGQISGIVAFLNSLTGTFRGRTIRPANAGPRGMAFP